MSLIPDRWIYESDSHCEYKKLFRNLTLPQMGQECRYIGQLAHSLCSQLSARLYKLGVVDLVDNLSGRCYLTYRAGDFSQANTTYVSSLLIGYWFEGSRREIGDLRRCGSLAYWETFHHRRAKAQSDPEAVSIWKKHDKVHTAYMVSLTECENKRREFSRAIKAAAGMVKNITPRHHQNEN